MIQNKQAWEQFENNLIANGRLDYQKNTQIFEALWREAVALGALPLSDPLAGFENDVELSRILNSCSKTS